MWGPSISRAGFPFGVSVLSRLPIESLLQCAVTGQTIDTTTLLRTAAWLLAAAAGFGAGAVALRFGFDRGAPPWLRRTHGTLAALGLAALAWACAGPGAPRTGELALALLGAAAAGGIVTSRARRWGLGLSPEVLAFGHLSVASVGYVMLLSAAIGTPG